MEDVIVVENLGKSFPRYHTYRPNTFREVFIRGFRRLKPMERFWALHNVSFDVARGEMLGVIGANGSGKSTLLRLISEVMRPDEGRVRVKGRIGGLLELGAGFHPDLSGRENLNICGVISGLSRQEVAQRFDSIVSFAEIEYSLDSPVRSYSSGMLMRLAFSIAVHTDPEILLIDEVLTVGDIAFERKCLKRIAKLKAEGCTMVLVTHNTNQVQQYCDKTLWLRRGQPVAYGEPEVVVGQYIAEMSVETKRRTPIEHPVVKTSMGAELRVNHNRFGSLEMEIVNVRLLDSKGGPVQEIICGDPLTVEIHYRVHQSIDSPIFSVTLSNDDQTICFDTSTALSGMNLPTISGKGRILLHLNRLDLNSGQYYVDVGVYEQNWTYAYDSHCHVYPLLIASVIANKGVISPPFRWEFLGGDGGDAAKFRQNRYFELNL